MMSARAQGAVIFGGRTPRQTFPPQNLNAPRANFLPDALHATIYVCRVARLHRRAERAMTWSVRGVYGMVSTVAGSGPGTVHGFDGALVDGPALAARFDVPIGVAVDEEGCVYVVDSGGNRIRRISPDGAVSTVAGSGVAGYADGPAAEAEFWYPTDIAVGPGGRL
jgi:DNA-binding beta-propeller fold protein YncE